MSLIVKFIIEDENESYAQEPSDDSFGFESWRELLWGNPIILELGCEIIPNLKNTDIFATGKELEKLKKELLLIENNLVEVSKKTRLDKVAILSRISNALEFIKIAEKESNIIGIYIG